MKIDPGSEVGAAGKPFSAVVKEGTLGASVLFALIAAVAAVGPEAVVDPAATAAEVAAVPALKMR
jgi:hypothetical protein